MPRTGPNRFAALVLVLLAAFGPQVSQALADDTPYAALARFASALSSGDGGAAISIFDKGMKGYGGLESSVQALVAQAEVLCSVEVLQESASGTDKVLDTDWYLQLKSRADGGPSERRRERVSVTMRLAVGTWRIVSISSGTVLAPINIR